jgi:hypothetical protein
MKNNINNINDKDDNDNDNDNSEKIKRSDILNELINKQLKNVPSDKKLYYNDLERLVKYIDRSIFDKKKCCLWSGYVTNSNVKKKIKYVNFYFRKKKTALHRILYLNYVDDSNIDGYITFTCKNKGQCCNVRHMKFNKYHKKNDNDNDDDDNDNDDNDNDKNKDKDKDKDNKKKINNNDNDNDNDNDNNDNYKLDLNFFTY